uniref:ORF62 n=1 Tax=Human herpesvirus 3 TaxID=10335 RepID=A0A1B1JFK7_HHV3|nr:ORF62 [Human alphaherpesvirus 3]ANS13314.1 ORF71 [Human alphaherpesvirus 3]
MDTPPMQRSTPQRAGSPDTLELMDLLDAAAAAAEHRARVVTSSQPDDLLFGENGVMVGREHEIVSIPSVSGLQPEPRTEDVGEELTQDDYVCEDGQDLMGSPVIPLAEVFHTRFSEAGAREPTGADRSLETVSLGTKLARSPKPPMNDGETGRGTTPPFPQAFSPVSPASPVGDAAGNDQREDQRSIPRQTTRGNSPGLPSVVHRDRQTQSISGKKPGDEQAGHAHASGDGVVLQKTQRPAQGKSPKKKTLKVKVPLPARKPGGPVPGPVEQLYHVLSDSVPAKGAKADLPFETDDTRPRKHDARGITPRVPGRSSGGKPRAFLALPGRSHAPDPIEDDSPVEKKPKSREFVSSSSSSSSWGSSSEDEDDEPRRVSVGSETTGSRSGREHAPSPSNSDDSDSNDGGSTKQNIQPGYRSISGPDPRIRKTKRLAGEPGRQRQKSFSLPRSRTPIIPPVSGPLMMPDGSPWPGSAPLPSNRVRFGPSGETREGHWEDEAVRAARARYEASTEPVPLYVPELGDPARQYRALINLIYCPDRDPIAWLQNPKLTGVNSALNQFYQKLLPPGRAGTAVTGSVASPVPHVGEAMATGEALWALPHAAAAVAMSRRYDRAQKHFILQSLRRAFASMAYPEATGSSPAARISRGHPSPTTPATQTPDPQPSAAARSLSVCPPDDRLRTPRKRKSQPVESRSLLDKIRETPVADARVADDHVVSKAKRRVSEPVTITSGPVVDPPAVITMPLDGPAPNGGFRRIPRGALHTPVPSDQARKAYCTPETIARLVDDPLFPTAWRPALSFDPGALAEIAARRPGGGDRRFGPPSGVEALRRRCAWMRQIPDPEDVRLLIIYDPLPGEDINGPLESTLATDPGPSWSPSRGGLSVVLAALSNRLCLPSTHAWAGNWTGPPDVSALNARGVLLLSTRDLAFAGAVEYLGSRLASARRRLLVLDAVALERWPGDGPALSQYHVYVRAPARPDAQAVVRWPDSAVTEGLARAVFASSRTFGPASFARIETAFANLYPGEQPLCLCRGGNVAYTVCTRAGPKTRVPLSPREYRQYVLPGFDGCKDLARQSRGLGLGAADFVDEAAHSHRAANRWGLGAALRPVFLPEGRRPGAAGPEAGDVPTRARVFCRHALLEPDPAAEPLVLPPVAGRSVALYASADEARNALPPIPRVMWPPGFGAAETVLEGSDGTRFVFGHHGGSERPSETQAGRQRRTADDREHALELDDWEVGCEDAWDSEEGGGDDGDAPGSSFGVSIVSVAPGVLRDRRVGLRPAVKVELLSSSSSSEDEDDVWGGRGGRSPPQSRG